MRFLPLLLVLFALFLNGCNETGSVSPLSVVPNLPGDGGGTEIPPSSTHIWKLVMDGQGSQFAMGAVVIDDGVNLFPGLGPTLIPLGMQFEIEWETDSLSFTILGSCRASGTATVSTYLYKDGVLLESGIVGNCGVSSYTYAQY